MPDGVYDLLVIGSGPAGQKAAIQAAKLGRRVAVIERSHMVGGVCVNTGTIPSKTLREAVVYLTGLSAALPLRPELPDRRSDDHDRRSAAGEPGRDRAARSTSSATSSRGTTSSSSAGRRGSSTRTRSRSRTETAPNAGSSGGAIVVATGTIPSRPDGVEFDERTVLDSDGILNLDRIPSSLVVVGAGVIGIEYASMFAALGTRVTVDRAARAPARVLRRGDRRGAAVPPARPRRRVPFRRVGERGRAPRPAAP